MRIMVADDDAASRLLLTSILRSVGHEVEEACDGVDALERARRIPPDLLVSDILMPRMDGYRLLMEWKADPVLSQVPAIILTATYTDAEDERLAGQLGAESFLMKPVIPQALLDAVTAAPALGKPGNPHQTQVESREDALDKYSHRLVNKMEHHVVELEESHARLEAAVHMLTEEVEVKRRLVEALMRADQTKTDFMSVFAHELRTPLAAMKGYVDLLRHSDLEQPMRERALDNANRAVERLHGVVEDMVHMLELQTEAQLSPRSAVDLGQIVQEVAVRVKVDDSHKLELDINPGMPRITGDELRLRVAVEHLVDNAIKFSPEGGVVRIELRQDDTDAVLTVSDEGIGMPTDEAASLFDAFTQFDMSSTRQFGGLGLGLYIVSRAVIAHGGSVKVDSSPGAGSTFTVRLPIDGRAEGVEREAQS